MTLTVRQLRAFAAIYEAGSLAAASERLKVTPSAVSLILRDMERELGVLLFERSTRRLTPTPVAAATISAALEALRRFDAFPVSVRAAAERDAGHVTFAATAAIAASLGPRILSSFREARPDVVVRMLDVTPDAVEEVVKRGEVDFGLGTSLDLSAGLAGDKLVEDRVSVITWPGGPFHQAVEVGWRELSGVPTISVQFGAGIRELIERTLAQSGVVFSPTWETKFLSTAIGMAEERLGVLVLPALLAARAGGPLKAVPLVDPIVRRTIFAVRQAGSPLTPHARALVQTARRVARSMQP